MPSDEIPALTGFNFGETPELSKSLDTGAQIGKRIVEELSIEIGEPEQPIPPKEAPKVSALEGAKKGKSFGSTEERDFGQDGTDPRDDAVKTAVTQGADIGNTASFEDPSNLLRVPRESVRGVSRLPHSLDSTSDQATKSSEDRTLTATDAGDDPVHAGTGEFTITRTDFSLPGIGLPFYFQRIYRSRWQYESPIGFGWNHTYNQRLVLEDSTCGKRSIIHWITGRGGVVRFEPDPKGVGFQSAPPSPYLLEKKSNGFVITAPDGVTSHFSDGGLLQSTIDLNNNKLTFDWETSLNPDEWRLRQVIDTLGREINFRY